MDPELRRFRIVIHMCLGRLLHVRWKIFVARYSRFRAGAFRGRSLNFAVGTWYSTSFQYAYGSVLSTHLGSRMSIMDDLLQTHAMSRTARNNYTGYIVTRSMLFFLLNLNPDILHRQCVTFINSTRHSNLRPRAPTNSNTRSRIHSPLAN